MVPVRKATAGFGGGATAELWDLSMVAEMIPSRGILDIKVWRIWLTGHNICLMYYIFSVPICG